MSNKVLAISFAKPGEWSKGGIKQIGVVEEKANELREYATKLGYEENSRGPLEIECTDRTYNEWLNKDFKKEFK
ncbi:hypothetical protein [Guptibacillus hwajinpoensis]|uniref:hypothetical protein n=1 Tax=Guptibacillus hwajinpoensis TaxID=208199 RepID=UPI003CFEBABD